jgi:hypothetical protein
VAGRGFIVIGSIISASYYKVGSKHFPAVPVTEKHIIDKLTGLNFNILKTSFVAAEHAGDQGYAGLFMVLAQRNDIDK